jgi:hypothetical protein
MGSPAQQIWKSRGDTLVLGRKPAFRRISQVTFLETTSVSNERPHLRSSQVILLKYPCDFTPLVASDAKKKLKPLVSCILLGKFNLLILAPIQMREPPNNLPMHNPMNIRLPN